MKFIHPLCAPDASLPTQLGVAGAVIVFILRTRRPVGKEVTNLDMPVVKGDEAVEADALSRRRFTARSERIAKQPLEPGSTITELPDASRPRNENISLYPNGNSVYGLCISPDEGRFAVVTNAV